MMCLRWTDTWGRSALGEDKIRMLLDSVGFLGCSLGGDVSCLGHAYIRVIEI